MSNLSRRQFIQHALGAGLAFSVPGMTPSQAVRRGKERPTSLLMLWLNGGPSQLETWDPHPDSKVGGPTKAIQTKIKDVQIAEHFPRVAEQIHHLSIIRSLVSKEGDHQRGSYFVRTGYRPDATVQHPSLGSIVTCELPNEKLEIPSFVSLGYTNHPSLGGYLGGEWNAFRAREPGTIAPTFRAGVSKERIESRLKSLDVVGKAFARGRKTRVKETLHRESVRGALSIMTSEQLKAFEIKDEPVAIRRAYGDSNFGRGCLVARRLLEQGCRAVEVSMTGFDTHEDNFARHAKLAETLDPALSSLIQDLVKRDLLSSTVILCMGEFGRTPKINKRGGRDHWPNAFSCVVGGGGLPRGRVFGATDPTGKEKKPTNPIKLADLYATILQTLSIRHDRSRMTKIGRPMKYTEGEPLKDF